MKAIMTASENGKRGERRSRSSSSKNTLYYNDDPESSRKSRYSAGSVWISSLLESCAASGMQLLQGGQHAPTCAGTVVDVSATSQRTNNTCSTLTMTTLSCGQGEDEQIDDAENIENNNIIAKKMNNIIYKQQQQHQTHRRRHSNGSSNNINDINNNNNVASSTAATAAGGQQDFSKLHDDFLESLLAEASSLQEGGDNRSAAGGSVFGNSMDDTISSADSSMTGLFSRLDSTLTGEEEQQQLEREVEEEEARRSAAAAAAARKRRRPLRSLRSGKHHKDAPPPPPPPQHSSYYQSFAPQEGNDSNNNNNNSSHSYTMNDESAAALYHKRNTKNKDSSDHGSVSSEFNNIMLDLNSTTTNANYHYQEPSVFLHEHVRMQKDKGKGEAVGSNICAKGKLACLQKLRAKMRLLTEVALKDAGYSGGGDNYSMSNASTNSGSVSATNTTTTNANVVVTVGATMKRKKARIALQTETFCETRSLIQLKMGFLSMTYGVLLRWDCTRTRTITLVVLRKNCHEESFYPRQLQLLSHMSSSTTTTSSASSEQHPNKRHKEFTNNDNNNNNSSSHYNNASLPSSSPSSSSSRQQGMKNYNNAVLDPPYSVPRPLGVDQHTSATILQVSVLYATGLNKRCNWTIQLLLQGRVESILLAYDADRDRLYPKLGEALRHELPTSSFAPSLPLLVPPPLEIKLWEHTASSKTARGVLVGGGVGVVRRSLGKSSKNSNSRRLVCAMRVSWDDLPISTTTTASSASSTTGTTNPDSALVTVPCLHDVEHATIGLGVVFQSDYLYWLRQELQARRDCHQGGGPASSLHTPVSTNRSSLPTTPSLCCLVDAAAASCSFINPLSECTSSMTNRIVSPPQQQRQQQKQEEEETNEDANSPWEWICSVC